MKILFEIKENLADIENQLLHSDFWITEVEERPEEGKKIVTIRDFAYPQEATAEITDKGICIQTAWSKYTYRLPRIAGAKVASRHHTERKPVGPRSNQLLVWQYDRQDLARICHGQPQAEALPPTDLR